METPDKIEVYAGRMRVGTMTPYSKFQRISAHNQGNNVGAMAPYSKFQSALEYDSRWLRQGFSISPLSLPLESGVKIARPMPFEEILGIFYVSDLPARY